MVVILVVEGVIGVGKTTLLRYLAKKHEHNPTIAIWLEPSDRFNSYKIYHPLELFYKNPKEAPIVQLHIQNVLLQYYKEKLNNINSEVNLIITERSLFSCLIFIQAQLEFKLLSPFQADYLLDLARANLSSLPNLCDKIFYLRPPSIETILSRLEARSHCEVNLENKEEYIQTLVSCCERYIHSYRKSHPPSSVVETFSSDIEELANELESFAGIK